VSRKLVSVEAEESYVRIELESEYIWHENSKEAPEI
jgi:hypothetical protein